MRRTLETQLEKRLDGKRGDVSLRNDFAGLGGYVRVGRILRQLVRRGSRLGSAPASMRAPAPSTIDGTPSPVKDLRAFTDEGIRRLGETLRQLIADHPP